MRVPERDNGRPDRREPVTALIRADVARYFAPGRKVPAWRKVKLAIWKREVTIIILYRIGTYVYHGAPRFLSFWIKLFWKPLYKLASTLYDTHIWTGARIGPGLYIGHRGGIWINPGVTIGANCNISQGVIIGAAGGNDAPIIGSRVWIGPHAVVTGSVKVGDDVVIGANSLVASDVPDKALVLGVPARVVMYSGSGRLIRIPQ